MLMFKVCLVVSKCYGWELVFIRLEVSNSYV